jgi:two-component system response regulator
MSTHTIKRKLEILIVEDDPMDALLVKRFLERAQVKFNLMIASDGEVALDFLYRQNPYERSPHPDLIILDMGLPKVNGQEVLESLKNDAALRKIPVVVLTGQPMENNAIKRWNLHEHCFVNKWFNMTDFLSLIKAVEDYWANHGRRLHE